MKKKMDKGFRGGGGFYNPAHLRGAWCTPTQVRSMDHAGGACLTPYMWYAFFYFFIFKLYILYFIFFDFFNFFNFWFFYFLIFFFYFLTL